MWLKPVLRVPNLALSFCDGSKHTVVRSAWRFSNSSMDHHGKQINHRSILWWSKDEDSTGTCCDRHLGFMRFLNITDTSLYFLWTHKISLYYSKALWSSSTLSSIFTTDWAAGPIEASVHTEASLTLGNNILHEWSWSHDQDGPHAHTLYVVKPIKQTTDEFQIWCTIFETQALQSLYKWWPYICWPWHSLRQVKFAP